MFTNREKIDAAVQRMASKAGVDNPYPAPKLTVGDGESGASFRTRIGPHLKTAYVPALPPTVSFALRRFGAQKFANIWLDVKNAAQSGKGVLVLIKLKCKLEFEMDLFYFFLFSHCRCGRWQCLLPSYVNRAVPSENRLLLLQFRFWEM